MTTVGIDVGKAALDVAIVGDPRHARGRQISWYLAQTLLNKALNL